MNRYARHLDELARQHGVFHVQNPDLPPERSVSVPFLRVIETPPVTEETLYAVALHEMGHVVAPGGAAAPDSSEPPSRQMFTMLAAEDAAWAWARATAIEWNEAMQRVMDWGRESYARALRTSLQAYITPSAPRRKVGDILRDLK